MLSIRKSTRTVILALFIKATLFFFFSTVALASTITLAWDRPDGATVAGYNIYYGLSGTSYKGSPRKTTNSPDQTQFDIANLEPGKTYVFSATSHDGNGNESGFSEAITYQVPLSQNDEQFTITASAGNGGSIEPAGNTVVSYGGSVTYAISPAAGHEISDVIVNGSSVGRVDRYTISSVTSENTINAIFSEIYAPEYPEPPEPPEEYFSGSGTIEDPFLVFDSEQLDRVRELPDNHFKLKDDIDLGDFESFVPIGSFKSPFTGSFDGNGHIIKNLVIDESYSDYVGLFAFLEGAIIKNTGIDNANVFGVDYVGILAGYVVNSTISETYVTGFVSGQHFVGGLVGSMEADSMALISDSYADCNVDGIADVGGLVGNLGLIATIESAYAVGDVQGATDIGGLVGWNNRDLHDNVTNSFWDAQIGPDESKGGTGKTTAEMMQQTTFTNWDFKATWAISGGNAYPYLQWQHEMDNLPVSLVLDGNNQALDIVFDTKIIGTGAKETINIAPDINVSFAAGDGDRVNLPHNMAHYEITSMGNQIFFSDVAANKVVTIIVTGTSTVGFADGDTATLEMVFSSGGPPQVQLGGVVVGSVPLE